jgi:acyl carrier protein
MESVAFLELQVALEDELGIEIDPVRVVELNELGKIADYIHALAIGQT